MSLVHNPILPGFHPDPSIVRVGGWYYLATSTFEWWPGVRIHRSRDLGRWELAGHALTRRSQLDMRGNPDSGGVWAPCLSHADGRFWLVYSDVKALNGPAKDLRNYLVTAPRIGGPWSEPVLLNASGFDASLFHDLDGSKWLLCQHWEPTLGRSSFAGISLQRFDPKRRRLVGGRRIIFAGSSLGIVEGPHLYQKDGYYYLVTAEGGTGFEHAVTVARSRHRAGPYTLSPQHPLLTSHGAPRHPLQKAGHASFVETPVGGWHLVHLASRPVGPSRRCILGRETALQAVDWPPGGWPRLAHGGTLPALEVDIPGAASADSGAFSDRFGSPSLGKAWSLLREPSERSWLKTGKGGLRLVGRHSLQSTFDQSLVGFRLGHLKATIGTELSFSPSSRQQAAGLVLYYNTRHFHALQLTAGQGGARELRILSADQGRYIEPLARAVPVTAGGAVRLEARIDGGSLRFHFAPRGGRLRPIGPVLDLTVLSDDRVIEGGDWGFTGTFVGLFAQDSSDSGQEARFRSFDYRPGLVR